MASCAGTIPSAATVSLLERLLRLVLAARIGLRPLHPARGSAKQREIEARCLCGVLESDATFDTQRGGKRCWTAGLDRLIVKVNC